MAQDKRPQGRTKPPRPASRRLAAKSPLPTSAFHDKRVRLFRVVEAEGAAVQQYELLRRVGKEGVGDSVGPDGQFAATVSVLFDDGCRLTCLPAELEVCTKQTGPHPAPTHDATVSYVQSCIAHVSFPETLLGIGHVFDGTDDTSMEQLLWPPEGHVGGWTAPRWLTTGDIIFFYHTEKALARITRLMKSASPDDEEWKALPDPHNAFETLRDQIRIALDYAGTIFGCARVTGAAAFWRDDDKERDRNRHWRSNIYAEITRAHTFAHPISREDFGKHITISPGGAITPLHGQNFKKLKELLAEKNQLPDYLVNAHPGGVSFREVNSTNWIGISCSPQARFIDESQLRAYLLDYLLEELKDPRTTVHHECRCGLDKKYPGIADYFVRVHGRWVPVEAKLNVRAERDLPGQVLKYLGMTEFIPTRGSRAGQVVAGPVAPICLAADVEGLYLLNPDGFVDCGPDRPFLKRTQITTAAISAIRDRLH